jgi:anti-sigma factor RsiW
MNKCTEVDVQEMLPDLLHGKLDARARARVEAHVATCEDCTEDLDVLRTVKSAAVFIPAIDVDRVVRQIPPYRAIVPAAQAPARSRAVSWLVAASLAVVVLGGGSLLMIQQQPLAQRVVIKDGPDQRGVASRAPLSKRVTTVAQKAPVELAPRPHALAMATGVDGLSDNNLRQLMNDMDSFDALPTTEPEPVISVDNGDGLDR